VGECAIRPAIPGEGARLNAALRALSDELGDRHSARDTDLAAALFCDPPAAHALVAEAAGEDALAGIVMFSPQFSTTRGAAGLYVSDLWIAPAWRGTGLGRRLLATACDQGKARWGAAFLCLKAYADASHARRFYRRLGFTETTDTHHLTLDAQLLIAPGGRQ